MTLTSWIYDNNNNNSFDQKNLNWSRGKKPLDTLLLILMMMTTEYFFSSIFNVDDLFFLWLIVWVFFSLYYNKHTNSPLSTTYDFHLSSSSSSGSLNVLWFFIVVVVVSHFIIASKKIWKKKRWSPLTLQKKTICHRQMDLFRFVSFVHSFIDWRRALFPNIHSFIHLFNQILFHMFVWSLFFFYFQEFCYPHVSSSCHWMMIMMMVNERH